MSFEIQLEIGLFEVAWNRCYRRQMLYFQTTCLETEFGLEVIGWDKDFHSGVVIMTEIERAVHSSKYGVFLFTPDDTITDGRESYKVPRANVVFEAGYFINQHGLRRTLIIVQEGTRVLADYSGYIYPSFKDGLDLSSIRARFRQTFAEDLS
jgi:predicted nucleotide-binding protein